MEIKPERLKYLFGLVIQSLDYRDPKQQTGICKEIKNLFANNVINIQEKDYLSNYLLANRPTENNDYKEFMIYPYWENTEYWWIRICVRPHSKQIRIDFLTKLISNIK